MLSSALPITPAGIGVGEVVFDQVCQLFLEPGVSYGFAGLFLSFRALIALAATPGLVVLILMQRKGECRHRRLSDLRLRSVVFGR